MVKKSDRIPFQSFRSSENYSLALQRLNGNYEVFRSNILQKECLKKLSEWHPAQKQFLTQSATAGLMMAADSIEFEPGDEIIVPSFTFVSALNPFVRRGVQVVFVPANKKTFGPDLDCVQQAITSRTKAIMIMHYGGVPCASHQEITALSDLARARRIVLIEDAATCFGSMIEGKPLGSMGDYGVISFDITKHITSINGGLCLVSSEHDASNVAQVYHNGTNRTDFERGSVDFYDWYTLGSKYAMNALSASILLAQLESAAEVLDHHLKLSRLYIDSLEDFAQQIARQVYPRKEMLSNGHLFAWIVDAAEEQKALIEFLDDHGIECHSHYRALHASPMGLSIGKKIGDFSFTEQLPFRIVRLPIHTGLDSADIIRIASVIKSFYLN